MSIQKKRACIYVRVSTDEQALHGVSLDAQKESILKYIEQHSDQYTIDTEKHIYIDAGASGISTNRHELNRLMSDAKKGEFDILLVWKIDRLFRSTLQLLEHVDTLFNYHVEFKSITQEFETNTAYGKMILGVLGVIAELERDMIRERTILGKMRKAKQGFYVGGKIPKFGYDVEEVKGGKMLKINEFEAKLIQRIFDLYVNGGKSLGEIANLFTLEQIPTKYDTMADKRESGAEGIEKHDKHRKNRIRGHWYPSTISEILKNTRYIGEYYYGRKLSKIDNHTKKQSITRRELDDPKVLKLDCPAIIRDSSIFYKAQELLIKNRITKSNKTTYTFTGYIKCGICGRSYTGYKSSKGTMNYRCVGSTGNKLPKSHRCTNMQISEDTLTDMIWNKIRSMFINPDIFLEEYYKHTNENIEKISELRVSLIQYDKDINHIKEAINRAYMDLYSDMNSDTQDRKRQAIAGLTAKIDMLEIGKDELSEKYEQLLRIEESKKNLHTITKKFKINLERMSSDKKRIELIHKLLDVVTIDKKELTISFKFGQHLGEEKKGKNDKKNDSDDDDKGQFFIKNNENPEKTDIGFGLLKPLDSEVKSMNGVGNIAIGGL